MVKNYLCGLLMGIAIMNIGNAAHELFIAKRNNDRTGILLMRSCIAIGAITLALQILWLLKLARQ